MIACRPLLFSVSLACCTSALAAPIDRLAWLGGCWASTTGEPGSGEQWLAPAGGSMLGVGRTVKNGKTSEYEFLHIRADDEGKLLYIALPSGQKQATFTEKAGDKGDDKAADGNQIVFENLQHDFPQRVIYRLENPQKLLARIEGMRGGKLKGIDFPLQRVACANALP